jgi:[protein-PII] uridylyltransferase
MVHPLSARFSVDFPESGTRIPVRSRSSVQPHPDSPDSDPGAWLAGEDNAVRQAHAAGADGLRTALALAAARDQAIRACADCLPQDAAVVAIGAYGRGALNPCVTPRFLVVAEKPARPVLKDFVQRLAAAGLEPAMRIADRDFVTEAARGDAALATALLDARLVVGPEALLPPLAGFANTLIARLPRDIRARHRRSSDTVFLQEPNVKESCGGLDDCHAMRWLCLLRQGAPTLDGPFAAAILDDAARQEIVAAVAFLHRVRHELHYHTGAPTDRLTLMLQGVVAEAFHYPQRNVLRRTEALMRDFYRHAFALHQHAIVLLEHFTRQPSAPAQTANSPSPSPTPPAATAADEDENPAVPGHFDGFLVKGHHLEPLLAEPFADDPNRLMRLFLHCQVRQLTPGPRLRQLITAHLPRIDRPFRVSQANRKTFEAILEHKGEVAPVLRLMHRCGVLGRYLPEFGALDALVQHEFFHRFTADEHTLRVIEELDRLVAESRPERALFRRIFHELGDPFAFYLAMLLHDTGRAEDVDEHTDGSMILVKRLCDRLGIAGPRRAFIGFLVENHLNLWRTATTRNIEDPEVVAEFAAAVRTQANLDALLLFTYCDSSGTSPEAWNGWREFLMLQLHAATSRFLGGGDRTAYDRQLAADLDLLRDAVIAKVRDDLRAEAVRHFELMPAAAFHYRQPNHIVAQVRTVARFLAKEASRSRGAFCVRWLDHLGMGYTELILVTRDRPLLLEQLCCALAACEINILSADFFTRADQLVVDVFRVSTSEHDPVADPALRERFLDCFEVILKSEKHDPRLYLHHLGPAAAGDSAVPARATVDNHQHPACTTVELQAADRIGILHDVFFTVNALGLSTAHARISTEKGVALDTLYITTRDGAKVTDPATLETLAARLSAVAEGAPLPS